MSIPPRYLDRDTATALLAAQGFNSLDIECILDLTGPATSTGTSLWSARSVERLASRAWWLDRAEVGLVLPHAA
ncbi:hypothetical protein [Parvibaculum sp.]|uniref:hypothetical protein n=1 Tax=Parvibaculum sp. TaxID=2024848 RepID=UPI002731887A|nr:hypothetical protein [Parvibaculum sp.]MDP1628193.1 hypothetical protein [Parvibaculum sp.]MDP2148033.1 hypothetical protein [Parvibaculum sp.]MDP3326895.1 hypothetical protein [Parvibaculum sp.]